MGFDFYIIVGGSLALSLLIYYLGVRQERAERESEDKD